MSDHDRLLSMTSRILTDGCDACNFSKVYCDCVAYVIGNDAACCDLCTHGRR